MILAKFRVCAQVGPNDYAMISEERLFEESSTIKDVKDWVMAKGGEMQTSGKIKRMMEIQLSEPSY